MMSGMVILTVAAGLVVTGIAVMAYRRGRNDPGD